MAIVISCHKSAAVIVRTCRACMHHVPQRQIFVMDNADFKSPPDNTKQLLKDKGLEHVNYIYNCYGNKTLALYAGAVAAKDYSRVMLIDDDVTLPDNMNFGLHWFSNKVKAVCYPIQAVHPHDPESESLFIEWQAIEYKMGDYTKLIQNEFSTVLYPHGAACLWDRAVLIECLRAHDTIFYGDDLRMGMWLQYNNYEMRLYHQSPLLKTDAPSTLIGPCPNYYAQRVRSWDMAEHVYAYQFYGLFLSTIHTTVTGTLILKWYQFYSCYCVLVDWIRLPVTLLSLLFAPEVFAIISACFLVLYTALTFLWDLIGYRKCPQRRARKMALLTFQGYKIISLAMRLLGFGRAMTVYLPNFQPKPTIKDLEAEVTLMLRDEVESGGKIPVWMDKTNPYYTHYDPRRPTEVIRKPQRIERQPRPFVMSNMADDEDVPGKYILGDPGDKPPSDEHRQPDPRNGWMPTARQVPVPDDDISEVDSQVGKTVDFESVLAEALLTEARYKSGAAEDGETAEGGGPPGETTTGSMGPLHFSNENNLVDALELNSDSDADDEDVITVGDDDPLLFLTCYEAGAGIGPLSDNGDGFATTVQDNVFLSHGATAMGYNEARSDAILSRITENDK